jgi:hypothetical protein
VNLAMETPEPAGAGAPQVPFHPVPGEGQS